MSANSAEYKKGIFQMFKGDTGIIWFSIIIIVFFAFVSIGSCAYAGNPYWCCDKCGSFTDDAYTTCSGCGSPMERYKVYLDLDFKSNLLFSRYGVNITIDDVPLNYVEHGNDRFIKFRLKEGLHTVKFVKFDDENKFASKDIYIYQSEMLIKAEIETNRFGVNVKKWEAKNITDPYELKFDWKIMGTHKGHHYLDLDTMTFKTTYTKGTTQFGRIIGSFDNAGYIQLVNENKTRTDVTNYVLKGDWLYLCDSNGEPYNEKPDIEYDCKRDNNYEVFD